MRLGPSVTITLAKLSAVVGKIAQTTWRTVQFNLRLNTGKAPTCDWMIKIAKANKLYRNSLLVSIVNRVSRSGTMKYQSENTDVSNKKWQHT